MSFSVTTVNVNGVRAATKQRNEHNLGLNDWLERSSSDVVLLQEVRATEEQARAVLSDDWHAAFAPAAAKGRAGVAILSRHPLVDVTIGLPGFEDAGRWIEATVQGIRVASLYLPSGEADTPKQEEKYAFLDMFGPELARRAEQYPEMVVGGDWNICHRREDLKNWKTNQKKSGFLPQERAFMDSVFGTFPDAESQLEESSPARDPQWFDVARRLSPEGSGPYTWWTYRGRAFDNDAGWRIDYQAATRAMLERAVSAEVDKVADVSLRWSDHAPLTVVYV